MSATLEQQRKIEQLEARLRALDEAEAADAKRASDVNGYSAFDEMVEAATEGGKSVVAAAPRAAQEMAIEGGGAVVGGAIGALPMFSVPTAGLSVAAGSALGSMAGNAINQFRRGGEISKGELAASGVTSLVPMGKLSVLAGKSLAKEAAKQAGGNLAATATQTIMDEGRLPTFNEAAMSTATSLGGVLAGKKVASDSGARAEVLRRKQNRYNDEVIKRGIGVGYVFDPAASNPNAMTQGVMVMSHPAEYYRSGAVANQAKTNELVRLELGLHESADLGNPLTLEIAKNKAKVPYVELSSISPTAKAGLEKLQSLRAQARDYWNEYGRDAKVEAKKKAISLDSQARSVERGLEALAVKAGKPELVGQLKVAREQLSKIHFIESASHATSGNVDAVLLSKIHDKNRELFTGNLKLIAESASVNPYMFRDASNLRGAITDVGGLGPFSRAYDATVGRAIRTAQNTPAYQSQFAIPQYNTKVQDPVATFLLRSSQSAGRP